MEPTDELEELLTNMAQVFDDGRRTDLSANGDGPSCIRPLPGGPLIEVNTRAYERGDDGAFVSISGPNELRCIVDTVSHEVEHKRVSDLNAKGEFIEANDRAPKLAGMVINLLEDAYIDALRVERFPGLRSANAYTTRRFMEQRREPADIPDRASRAVEVFMQATASGYVKGIDRLSDEFTEFAARCRQAERRIHETHDAAGRERIAQERLDDLLDVAGWDDLRRRHREGARAQANDADAVPSSETDPMDGSLPSEAELDDSAESADEQAEAEAATSALDDEPADADADDEPADADDEQADDALGGSDGSDADDGDDAGAESSGDDAGDDTDASPESGERADDDRAGGDDADAGDDDGLDDDIEAMRDADERGLDAERHGLDDDTTADDIETSERFESKYQQLRDRESGPESDIEARKRERDERAEGTDGAVDDEMSSGLADDIRRAFERFTHAYETQVTTSGSSLNLRNVVRNRSGDYNERHLYERRDPGETGGRFVGVALDMSGSMVGSGEHVARCAVAALAEACEQVGDAFGAVAFHDTSSTSLITAPDERFRPEHVESVRPSGMTPMGYGMRDVEHLSDHVQARQRVMFVVTDGQANCDPASTTDSEGVRRAVRERVERLRREGWIVIGLGAGGGVDDESLRECFGDASVRCTFGNLTDTLIDVYRSQLDTAESTRR
jgi:hypothetical protein